MKRKISKIIDKVSDIGGALDKVGASKERVAKELWKIAGRRVKKVNASDKLKAIELIAKIRGWIRGDIGVQSNILIGLLSKESSEIDNMIEYEKSVSKEIDGE